MDSPSASRITRTLQIVFHFCTARPKHAHPQDVTESDGCIIAPCDPLALIPLGLTSVYPAIHRKGPRKFSPRAIRIRRLRSFPVNDISRAESFSFPGRVGSRRSAILGGRWLPVRPAA